MLRRLLATLLIAAIAMPVPTVAFAAFGAAPGAASIKRCAMPEHAAMGTNHRCCCDDPAPARDDATAAHEDCARPSVAAAPGDQDTQGCGCLQKADPAREPVSATTASVQSPLKAPVVDIARIPASLSTPRREVRALHLADPPPAPGLVSRPLLCSWTL